ncbi:putative aromatic compound dioxygenase protein [Botryosphaeria dothidea]|uniref:Aromatic compound dioxygenase protein n=1 Tax=Botryosphaeria dothidea TaxID=55169 RepID=A0A8H4J0Z0_9PEZI|nr:putative aromatic compound dioxygenase protein [Botryosphaeria dothidea]
MKFSGIAALLSATAFVAAHPEKHEKGSAAAQMQHELVARGSNKCAAQIEARKAAVMEKRKRSLYKRQVADGRIKERRGISEIEKRANKYAEIQNTTCVLAPDTIWGPYGIDGEIYRHDLRETQTGIDFYLDIGVLDVETCEPIEGVALSIWSCNATGSYAGFTGINPQTSELLDGWTKRDDGTTDDETFLRGIMKTGPEGIAEFLTKFPGYYVTRTTHIHVTAQANVTNGTSFSASSVQHIGQLFFEEDLLSEVYSLSPYSAHLSTLNRTTNAEDSVLSVAAEDGYSPFISTELLGSSLEDGLIGYITVGINASAGGLATTGVDVNPLGQLPTVSVDDAVRAAATSVDAATGYKKV